MKTLLTLVLFTAFDVAAAIAPADLQRLENLSLHGAPRDAHGLATQLAGQATAADAPAVEALLVHPDRRVRQHAAVVIGPVRPERALAELKAQVMIPEPDFPFWARNAVTELGVLRTPAALDALCDLVVAPPADVAGWAPEHASEALRSAGPLPVQKRLADAAAGADARTALFAAMALVDVDRLTAVRALERLWLRTDLANVRNALEYRITTLDAPELVPLLRDMLRGNSPTMKPAAIEALVRQRVIAAVDDFVMVVKTEREPQSRALALLAVSALGDSVASARATAALLALQLTPGEAVRTREALGLARIKVPAGELERWTGLLEPRTPADVAAAALAKANELCGHWGGEEPYDEARAKDIAEGAQRDCAAAAKAALKALRDHPKSAAVRAAALETLTLVEDGPADANGLKRALEASKPR